MRGECPLVRSKPGLWPLGHSAVLCFLEPSSPSLPPHFLSLENTEVLVGPLSISFPSHLKHSWGPLPFPTCLKYSGISHLLSGPPIPLRPHPNTLYLLAPPWPQWPVITIVPSTFPSQLASFQNTVLIQCYSFNKTLNKFQLIYSLNPQISVKHPLCTRHWEHSCERVLTSWCVYSRQWERWRYGAKKKKKKIRQFRLYKGGKEREG